MIFQSKVIKKSRKAHKCLMCLRDIPQGSIYLATPYKADNEFGTAKMCAECAYLLKHSTVKTFSEGAFTDIKIPNFLRKIRNEYRKNPQKAWSNIE